MIIDKILLLSLLFHLQRTDCGVGTQSCDSSNNSLVCDVVNGYYLSGNSCLTRQINGCKIYNLQGYCEICNTPHHPSSTNDDCLALSSSELIDQCVAYNNLKECTQCLPTHTLSSNQCLLLNNPIFRCKSHKSNPELQCEECEPGYYLNTSKNQCIQDNNSNCLSRQQLSCQECLLGQENLPNLSLLEIFINFYTQNFIKNSNCYDTQISNCASQHLNQCIYCDINRFLNGNECVEFTSGGGSSLIDNCDYYTDSSTCYQCQMNFELFQNQCRPQTQGDGCELVSTRSTICDQCKDDFYQDINGICQPRTLPYANCTSRDPNQDHCLNCNIGFIFNENQKICQDENCQNATLPCTLCKPTFYELNGLCVQGSIANCQTYQSQSDVCLECDVEAGYELQNGFCVKVYNISNCEIYDQNGLCSKCQSNFLKFQIQQKCTFDNSQCGNGEVYNSAMGQCVVEALKDCGVNTSPSDTVCQDCKNSFFELINSKCIDMSYVKENCSQPFIDTNNLKNSYCQACDANSYPAISRNICIRSEDINAISGFNPIDNCVGYLGDKCIKCENSYFLNRDTCISESQCSNKQDEYAIQVTPGNDGVNAVPEFVRVQNYCHDKDLLNNSLTVLDSINTAENCEIFSYPSLYPLNKLKELKFCIKCKSGFQPVIEEIYLNSIDSFLSSVISSSNGNQFDFNGTNKHYGMINLIPGQDLFDTKLPVLCKNEVQVQVTPKCEYYGNIDSNSTFHYQCVKCEFGRTYDFSSILQNYQNCDKIIEDCFDNGVPRKELNLQTLEAFLMPCTKLADAANGDKRMLLMCPNIQTDNINQYPGCSFPGININIFQQPYIYGQFETKSTNNNVSDIFSDPFTPPAQRSTYKYENCRVKFPFLQNFYRNCELCFEGYQMTKLRYLNNPEFENQVFTKCQPFPNDQICLNEEINNNCRLEDFFEINGDHKYSVDVQSLSLDLDQRLFNAVNAHYAGLLNLSNFNVLLDQSRNYKFKVDDSSDVEGFHDINIENCYTYSSRLGPVVDPLIDDICFSCLPGFEMFFNGFEHSCKKASFAKCQSTTRGNYSINKVMDDNMYQMFQRPESGVGCSQCQEGYIPFAMKFLPICAKTEENFNEFKNVDNCSSYQFENLISDHLVSNTFPQNIICNSCNDNNTLIDQQCDSQITPTDDNPFCTVVDSNGVCTGCAINFQLNPQNQCVLIDSSCQNVDLSTGECLSCSPNHQRIGTECVLIEIENCQEIQEPLTNPQKCQKCSDQYVLFISSNYYLCISQQELLSTNCIKYSVDSQGNLTCDECLNGDIQNEQSSICLSNTFENCSQLSQNFNNFDQPNCIRCNETYILINGICEPRQQIPNCLRHEITEDKCEICQEGFLNYNNQQCQNIDNCILFSADQSICQECQVGYYLVQPDVNNLFPQCLIRSNDYSNCEEINTNLDQCLNCSQNHYLDNNGTCQPVTPINNCVVFTPNVDQCMACDNDQFYNETDNECQDIPVSQGIDPLENCQYHLSESECVVCQSGFYSVNGICKGVLTPLPGCVSYANENICLQCSQEYYLENDQCIQRQPSTQYCKQTEETYYGIIKCIECEGGYSYSENVGRCLPNDHTEDALSCYNQNCMEIQQGFLPCKKYNHESQICEQCSQGTLLSLDGTCLASSEYPLCVQLKETYQCLECKDGHSLNSEGICVENQLSNCLKSQSVNGQIQCILCEQGFHHNSNGQCISN